MKYPIVLGVVVFAAIVALPGCASKSKPTMVATVAPEAPIIEAYMEYVGPPERWAGPQTLVVHLTAKDPEFAQLTVNPPIAEAGSLLAPAAYSTMAGPRRPVVDGTNQIAYTLARDSLTSLAASVKDSSDQTFSGCLYPLRLKLVRSNGAVIERNGCRSIGGWPVVLSQVTNHVILASVHPASDLPASRAVASH